MSSSAAQQRDPAAAGPGPSTMAAKAPKQRRSLASTPSRRASRQLPSTPVSILRKPLLYKVMVPNLPLPPRPSPKSTMSSPGATYAPGCIDFPPLPPLPPFPASANVLRKSAPPSTSSSCSLPSRVRSHRSRVSFREEVDVAADELGRARRPASHGQYSSPPPAGRRPSAEGESAIRKASSKPVLKRAASATRLVTTADSSDTFDAQALRYPRVSPALARLSDSGSEIWPRASVSPLAASPQMASPQTMSPAFSPCPNRPLPPPPSAATTPARKTRQPVPSWSSTCPSLTPSSHRASLASTLTAPSTTSLLLSPHSPSDRFVPSHGYDDIPSMPPIPSPYSTMLSPSQEGEDAVVLGKARRNEDACGSEMKPRLQPAARISSRTGQSPMAPKVPRASERLLKLQSSLADLRMQRRADTARQERPRPSTPEAKASAQPPSPTVAQLMRPTPRKHEVDVSDDDSDLDLSLPLLNAALRSRVIPSSSRLLVSAHAPAPPGEEGDVSLGWSGSESEEEEFARTVTRIRMRKSGTVPPRLSKRPSLPAGRLRHREMSQSSDGRSSPSLSLSGPPTPSIIDRPSTALGTSANPTAVLLNALVEQKYAIQEALPRPKRFIEGWGAPEVLLEDDWPPDAVPDTSSESRPASSCARPASAAMSRRPLAC